MSAKSHKLHLPSTDSISSAPFELVFSDVWTSPVMSIEGCQYFVSFIEDYSRFVLIFPMILKSEVYDIFFQFRAFVKTQFSTNIKSFHFLLGW